MHAQDQEHITKEHEDTIASRLEKVMQFPEIQAILERLEAGLTPNLTYHSVAHTEDVIAESVLFSTLGGLKERECEMLAIAAAFHDAGYMTTRVRNEPIGAAFAVEELKKTGNWSEQEVRTINQMILDTQIYTSHDGPIHRPKLELSAYLIDSDVSNLGRVDFLEKAELIKSELNGQGVAFYQSILAFLLNHRWLSEPGILLRTDQKKRNIQLIKEKIYQEDTDPDSKPRLSTSERHLRFMSQLSLSLASMHISRKVIQHTIQALVRELGAETGTVFLHDEGSEELEFWALSGEGGELLGKKIPYKKGISGWVLQHNQSACVDNVKKDPRFFEKIDEESKFKTHNLVCVPLNVGGSKTIGTLQLLNKTVGNFLDSDVSLLEHVAPQIAMAIENSRLFEEVQQQKNDLEIINNRKRETLSIISHEFRTPLNIIQSSAELLHLDSLTEEGKEDVIKALTHGVEKLSAVVHQVINAGKVDSEELKVHLHEVYIDSLFAQLSAHYKEPARIRNQKLNLLLKFDGRQKVKADPGLLAIALKNLISNAIRFTPDEGEIKVTAEPETGMVRFAVSDTGIGIPKDQHTLVFEKFYEVGDSLSHSSGTYEFQSAGLGLGLNAVQSILKAHGATVHLDSTPGKGTTISFLLEKL